MGMLESHESPVAQLVRAYGSLVQVQSGDQSVLK